ncbi:MAG: hypothetical protein GY950_32555 [bacterium]|nr:hypothetical protein [bacterium]
MKKVIFAILIIFILNILLYIGTLRHDFLKDDFRLIVENHRIKDFQSFVESIDTKFFAFPDFPFLHYWRPLTMFTFYMDYKIWGLNPGGFHFFNILVNALNGVLVFLVFYFLSGKTVYSFFISLFFSVHPSHVEAVSWVSGRTDLLAAFFLFSAVLLFILFLSKKKFFYYSLSVVFFILGLLSKENAVLFPLAAVVLVFMNKERKNFIYILPLVVIDIFYILLHNSFTGVRDVVRGFSLDHIPAIFKTAGVYVKIILAPFFPAPYFSMQEFDGPHPEFFIFFIMGLGILVFIGLKRENYRHTIYSLLFFIFLLPVLDPEIVPSYPKIVIRFAYIPVVFAGVFFMDTLQLFNNKKLKRIFAVLLGVIGCIWAVETIRFQGYFADTDSHYRQLTAIHGNDSSLLLPLALRNAGEGRHGEALELVNRALAVNDRDRWLDVSELGGLLKANLLVLSGDRANAAEGKIIASDILAKTTKKEMKYFAHLVLSKFHEKEGNPAAALALLEKAEGIGETADLYFRMTLLCGKTGDYERALGYLEKGRLMNPEMPRYSELKQILLNAQRRSVTGD